MDILKRIGGLIKVYQKRVYLGLFLQLVVIVTLLLAPYITKDIVNHVIPNRDMARLVPLVQLLLRCLRDHLVLRLLLRWLIHVRYTASATVIQAIFFFSFAPPHRS